MRKLIDRIRNEAGAALVEYGMLVGLIAVVCLAMLILLGNQINGVFTAITAALTAAGITG